MSEYNGPNYSVDDFFTDDSDTFQNQYQELALTREEQEQQLVNLNTKLCNYCLIFCHFQYCDKCDLMFNPLPKILYPINKLSKSKKEEELLTKDILFQEPNQTTKIKQYLTDADFDLRYSGQLLIIIAPHFLVKIDLKIVLEVPISTMIQVVSRSSLAKKKIDLKEGIIDAKYMRNIIIESHEKIAQAIFLPLVKIPQLVSNIMVNFTEEDSNQQYILKVDQKIQNQALVFETNPKICSLADIANLYLPAKAYKHFKIPIYNLTEDIIEIPKKTLIGFISSDIQNSEKLQLIPDFAQLFLFCDITLQV
ncbi:hypothetical protein G9A89_013369 [Geosiphon pyriformis]|nr:hypothetical protein G9A89_013369 [Geosiphon pyriformis]